MAHIVQDFPIKASASRVFRAVSDPAELAQWWTISSVGEPRLGAEYRLCFGPEYDWKAKVACCTPDKEFEFEMTGADTEWLGTRVGFQLKDDGNVTQVRFHHLGWPAESEHYRISCHCWAMYLRILRRYLEHGETVPYEQRLDV
ncbi:MAG TPA: SRPBCC domain-containing protein [Gemmatimonadales bacterium]|nr:SRPBCC domain-containing protein [Gemmatimonadales bacterium]